MRIPLIEQKSDVFDQVMNVNVNGVWLCMKYEIPQMIRSGRGAIVNMSSVVGNGISTNTNICRKQTCCAWTHQISCTRICQIWNQNKCYCSKRYLSYLYLILYYVSLFFCSCWSASCCFGLFRARSYFSIVVSSAIRDFHKIILGDNTLLENYLKTLWDTCRYLTC